MSKIGLIVSREFNQRVRKKSFILTTILTPLLLVGLMVAPALVMQLRSDQVKRIAVVDRSGIVGDKLQGDRETVFVPADRSEERLREDKDEFYGYLVIGPDVLADPSDVRLYTHEASTLDLEGAIAERIGQILEAEKLKAYAIDDLPQIMQSVKTDVTLRAFRIDETGGDRASSSVLSMVSAYVFGFLIYMFVFMYGAMVMQGVVEEKSSKVLEIIVSSVRPFELMLGKILGIASVAVVQFLIWVAVVLVLGTAAVQMLAGDALAQSAAMAGQMPSGMDADTLSALRGVTDFGFLARMFGGFLVYFVGGYLLYAAMFAAIGSAVDNVQDTQQLQLPVTIPMIFALIVMMNVMREPNSSLAVWCSIIPLTSPIIMMARHALRGASLADCPFGRIALCEFRRDGVDGRQDLPGGHIHVWQETGFQGALQMDEIQVAAFRWPGPEAHPTPGKKDRVCRTVVRRLACLLNFILSAVPALTAQSFDERFSDCFSKGDTAAARRVLRQWEASAERPAEFFVAGLNYCFRMARQSLIVLGDGPGNGPTLETVDPGRLLPGTFSVRGGALRYGARPAGDSVCRSGNRGVPFASRHAFRQNLCTGRDRGLRPLRRCGRSVGR